MSHLFLGQVSLNRPWERGPEKLMVSVKLGQALGSQRHNSLGNGMSCCVVKGPGGNQVQRCFNEGCELSWISPEGIYPGIPSCAANGKPAACSTPAPVPTTPLPNEPQNQPVNLAPGQGLVSNPAYFWKAGETQPTSPTGQQVPVQNGGTTVPQTPTGAWPGEPFKATPVQNSTPLMQPISYPAGAEAAPQKTPIQTMQPPAQYPRPTDEPCPAGALSLDRWAYQCALAHRT